MCSLDCVRVSFTVPYHCSTQIMELNFNHSTILGVTQLYDPKMEIRADPYYRKAPVCSVSSIIIRINYFLCLYISKYINLCIDSKAISPVLFIQNSN